MKKAIVILAVAALAAPAFAGLSDPLPAAKATSLAADRVIPIYADLATSGYYANVATTAAYPLPVGDDIHAISGGTITTFTMGYYAPTTGNPAAGDVVVSFFANDPVDSVLPPWPPGAPAPIAQYTLSGLPTGAWIFTFTGVSVPVGADFWFEMDFSNAYGLATTPFSNAGPLITANPASTVGYSHDLYSQTGYTWGFGPLWADFALGFQIIPEPATIGLLAIAGLAVLRRR